MTPKQQRMLSVGSLVVGLVVVSALVISAVDSAGDFYHEIDVVLAGDYPKDRSFRVGGLVLEGSLAREPGSLELQFTLTDTVNQLPVSYTGVLPDLFRDGQGIIATGTMASTGTLFVADEILAKHDENYMAPEVAESLKKRGYEVPESQ
ncbi:MAG: cytochrome c maturation protein CcmE [Pseudomonadota bacterium]